MSLNDARALENTKVKLADLERRYEAAKARPFADAHARSLSLRSLATLIKQLKEEIARFEIRAGAKP